MPEPPRSPLALAKLHNPKWQDARHQVFLDELLVCLEQRKAPAGLLRRLETNRPIPADVSDDELLPFTRLAVSEPPRHGKSEECSRYFPAHYLGLHPDHHIIFASYGDNYAKSWGRKARNVLESIGVQAYGITVSKRTSAANDWEIEGHGGGMVTAGTGGAITGRGANLFIGDDLVKGASEAASPVVQESAWDWWQSEANSRLEIDADGLEPIVLLPMTRWNENDILGRILANEDEEDDGETWYVLRLPALAEENDALGRAPGEPLWPERRPLDFLQRIRRRISAYWWSALYQQRPTPLEGDLFLRNRWQYYDTLPSLVGNPGGIFVDTAGWKDVRTADFAAWSAQVRVGRDLYWLEAKHGRWTFIELIEELRNAWARFKLPIFIEETPWSRPLIQTLQIELEEATVVPFEIKGVAKEVRALAASPAQQAGQYWLPKGKGWTKEFVDEHAAFPNGAHDDFVDTTSMAAIRLLRAPLQPIQLPRDDTPNETVSVGGRI